MNKAVTGTTEYMALYIYAAACILPVFSNNYIPGFTALLLGWSGGLLGNWLLFFAWLANIFFLAALFIPQHKFFEKMFLSLGSILLASFFLFVKSIFGLSNVEQLYNPGIGCWFWFGSLFYLFFSILLQKKAA